MTQTARLLETLKHYLKIQGITYRILGQRLKLSESSVKRLFSDQSLSLKRLEKICSVLGLDLYELVRMSREQTPLATQFTPSQQQALLQDPPSVRLLLMLANGWTVEDLSADFAWPLASIHISLRKLEQLHLLEWLPQDRVRLCFERSVLWQRDSPVWQLWGKNEIQHFLEGDYEAPEERWLFAIPQLTPESRRLLLRELDRLMQHFGELQEADAALPASEREPTGVLIALRPWHSAPCAETHSGIPALLPIPKTPDKPLK